MPADARRAFRHHGEPQTRGCLPSLIWVEAPAIIAYPHLQPTGSRGLQVDVDPGCVGVVYGVVQGLTENQKTLLFQPLIELDDIVTAAKEVV